MENKSRSNPIFWLGITLGLILVVVLTIQGIQQVRAAAIFIMTVDDGGADDNPGQKDLNFVESGIDPLVPNKLYVNWGLDNTDWSGANTGDVCVLFDTDNDSFANYSYCVTVNGSPASILYNRLWLCSDKKSDRCTAGNSILFNYTTGAFVEVQELDPFGDPLSSYYDPLHVVGNTCSFNTDPMNCWTWDTHVETVINLADMGAPTVSPQLINVCSYPSESPGSDPSDCIFQAGAGFLKIVKVAQPNLPVDFTFNMGSGQLSTLEKSTWTLTGSSNTLDTYGIIAFAPGTTYDLTEVLPTGWSLGSASCVLDAASTGTLVGTTITDFTIETGKTTTCTFTNTRPVDLTIDKTDYDYLYGYATRGGMINYMITVTNADLVNSASSVVVTDVLDINISVDSDPWFTEGIQFSPIINRNGVLDPSVVCAVTGADLMGYGGTITCPLGTMAALEVVTIEFPATVDYDAPIESPIEFGLCEQNPNLQGAVPVDICNIVSVFSPDELPAQTGNNTDSDPKDVGKPTSVEVYNFTATGLIRTIKLEWETAHAHQHLGFNLYRASSLNGARTKITKINDELITENTYLDYVNGKTTYYYWLQSVDVNGLTESFGPVEAQVLKRYK